MERKEMSLILVLPSATLLLPKTLFHKSVISRFDVSDWEDLLVTSAFYATTALRLDFAGPASYFSKR